MNDALWFREAALRCAMKMSLICADCSDGFTSLTHADETAARSRECDDAAP